MITHLIKVNKSKFQVLVTILENSQLLTAKKLKLMFYLGKISRIHAVKIRRRKVEKVEKLV
jgi:hypothetical protein